MPFCVYPRCAHALWLLGLLLCLAPTHLSAGTTSSPVQPEDLLKVKQLNVWSISPDGKRVVYYEKYPDLAHNTDIEEYYLGTVDRSGRMTSRRVSEDSAVVRGQWSPDSKHLFSSVDGAITRTDLKGSPKTIVIRSAALKAGTPFRISPDGKSVAFSPLASSANPAPQARLMSAKRVGPDVTNAEAVTADEIAQKPNSLIVLDVATGRLTNVSSSVLSTGFFDWSPDSSAIAFEGSKDWQTESARRRSMDIYVVQRDGSDLRQLTTSDGWDRIPVWSPTGREIAYVSTAGRPDEEWSYGSGIGAIVSLKTGKTALVGEALYVATGSSPLETEIHWSKDGRDIFYELNFDFSNRLFRVVSATGKFEEVFPSALKTISDVHWSADGGKLAFVSQGIGQPPELYLSDTNRFSKPKRATAINAFWSAHSAPRIRKVSWPSMDGKFIIRGLLLLPNSSPRAGPYPFIVFNRGGPGMARQLFDGDSTYPLLALVDRGYAILIPNSRGRDGGGLDLLHGIRDSQSFGKVPADDVIAGANAMIKLGIANPARMGICGFSYGEILTTSVLMKDSRFKAAIASAGPQLGFVFLDQLMPDEFTLEVATWRDVYGVPDIYAKSTQTALFDELDVFNLNKIRTPILLETGQLDHFAAQQALFRGLLHEGVPVEHWVYPRSGHGWDEPRLILDSYRRNLRWFDYWLRDQPLGDPAQQAIYDRWKKGQ